MELRDNTKQIVKNIRRQSVIGRFLKKILVSESLFYKGTACWEWQGSKDRKSGYPRFAAEDDTYAHRVSFRFFIGEIEEGKEIDHLCRRRHCVNPCHLELVTRKQNQERMAKAKESCKNGHPWTPENTATSSKGRVCKTCRYENVKRWRENHPDKAREINTASKASWRQKQTDIGRTGRF